MVDSRSSWKRYAFWVAVTGVIVAWAVTGYWTLVAHGYLDSPWPI
jgi:hypothetical protein